MKKRLFATMLSAVLLISAISVNCSAASAEQFTDVKTTDWFYDAVDYAASNGLFSGTSDTTFSPNQSMTRGMFVTVLGRKSGVDTSLYTGAKFNDVKSGEYYAPYVNWAASNGIVNGTGAGKFSPNVTITREQIAKILYEYAQKTENDVSSSTTKYNDFPDKGAVSNYAVEGLKWATTHEIINGSDGKLEPKGVATRAQVAKIFMGAEDILVNTEIVTKPDPGPGGEDALKKAHEYLKYSNFSYQGLVEQLEYEKFSHEEAVYAADHCGADWNEQSLGKAKSYLKYSAFSYTGLIDQLEYEGFTNSQAAYGVDKCGANWNEQAVAKAKSYLKYSSFSRDELISQLEYDGFTNAQAVYGVDGAGL